MIIPLISLIVCIIGIALIATKIETLMNKQSTTFKKVIVLFLGSISFFMVFTLCVFVASKFGGN